MSLLGSISILGQALRNFQTAVQVTSNNIANANTVGYSRQSAVFSENSPLVQDNLSLGTGASVSTVDRLRNIYLDSQIQMELSTVGQYQALQTFASELSALFPSGGALNTAISNLSAAWSTLAANPTSLGDKTAVVNAATTMAQAFNNAAQQLYSMHQNLNTQVSDTIDKINSDLSQIAGLNQQIFQSEASTPNSQPNALLDAREQVMENLSSLINVTYGYQGNGMVAVNFAKGTLLDGTNVYGFKAISSTTSPNTIDVGYSGNLAQPADVTSFISSGQLGGMIQARDVELRQSILTLNEMAFGIIQRANEINHSAIASDGTTGWNLFAGTKASDMVVNVAVAEQPGRVGATRDASNPGDIATMQAAQPDFILSSEITSGLSIGNINPAATLASQAAAGNFFSANPTAQNSATSPGQLVISAGGNAVTIQWGTDQTLNQIIANINASSGGAFFATFDQTSQKVILVSKAPLTVYDQTGNLGQVLALGASLTSAAPINSGPIAALNTVVLNQPLNQPPNPVDINTLPARSGTSQVDGSSFSWFDAQSLLTILVALRAATPAGAKVNVNWNPATQTISLFKAGSAPNTLLTQANPLTSIKVADIIGNFSLFTNFNANLTLNNLADSLVTGTATQAANFQLFESQSQNALSSFQAIQDSVTKVNTDQEIAQAQALQRSYEAAVRVQDIISQMLDVLINATGSPSTTTSAGSTVL